MDEASEICYASLSLHTAPSPNPTEPVPTYKPFIPSAKNPSLGEKKSFWSARRDPIQDVWATTASTTMAPLKANSSVNTQFLSSDDKVTSQLESRKNSKRKTAPKADKLVQTNLNPFYKKYSYFIFFLITCASVATVNISTWVMVIRFRNYTSPKAVCSVENSRNIEASSTEIARTDPLPFCMDPARFEKINSDDYKRQGYSNYRHHPQRYHNKDFEKAECLYYDQGFINVQLEEDDQTYYPYNDGKTVCNVEIYLGGFDSKIESVTAVTSLARNKPGRDCILSDETHWRVLKYYCGHSGVFQIKIRLSRIRKIQVCSVTVNGLSGYYYYP